MVATEAMAPTARARALLLQHWLLECLVIIALGRPRRFDGQQRKPDRAMAILGLFLPRLIALEQKLGNVVLSVWDGQNIFFDFLKKKT